MADTTSTVPLAHSSPSQLGFAAQLPQRRSGTLAPELEMSVQVLRERYNSGESVPSIAQRMGLTPRQVYRWMRHERINRRPPGAPHWEQFPISLEELREWYEAGESILGLARALDVSHNAVKYRLRSREDPCGQRMVLPVPSEVLRRRYEVGESLYDLADELGVSVGTVKLRLLEAGTRLRRVGGPPRSNEVALPISLEELRHRFEAGESLACLAMALGVPRNTLRGQLEATAKNCLPPAKPGSGRSTPPRTSPTGTPGQPGTPGLPLTQGLR
ncbi:helix-turn-helix domain-containing protein [Spirillospora sp. CA-128828]|uniref:helix-turn-helix domain-containing protein n=1 Tax=Spirillospora sp. CA-128828 TaxID=3240033 RepID=UPI003D92EC28